MDKRTMGLHTSAKYRQKRLRPAEDNMIAFDLGLLADGNEEDLKREYRKAPRVKRQKMLAALFAVYGCAPIARKLGIEEETVRRARRKYSDIETAALMSRNLSIAELSERKAFQLVASIDVSKVEDREKARSAKLLADVADLQYGQVSRMMGEGEEEATEELIYRVRRKVRGRRRDGEEDGDGGFEGAKDITGEVRDEARQA